MSRLENLLEKVRLKGHRVGGGGGSGANTTRWSHEDDDLYPAASSIPWDDVLIICIDHKLRDWQMPGPPVCEGGDRFFFFFVVIYCLFGEACVQKCSLEYNTKSTIKCGYENIIANPSVFVSTITEQM